jgi:hypothetical protein
MLESISHHERSSLTILLFPIVRKNQLHLKVSNNISLDPLLSPMEITNSAFQAYQFDLIAGNRASAEREAQKGSDKRHSAVSK